MAPKRDPCAGRCCDACRCCGGCCGGCCEPNRKSVAKSTKTKKSNNMKGTRKSDLYQSDSSDCDCGECFGVDYFDSDSSCDCKDCKPKSKKTTNSSSTTKKVAKPKSVKSIGSEKEDMKNGYKGAQSVKYESPGRH